MFVLVVFHCYQNILLKSSLQIQDTKYTVLKVQNIDQLFYTWNEPALK